MLSFWTDDIGIEMPDASFRLVPHPLAVCLYIGSQALST